MIHWSNFYTHWFVFLSLFEKNLNFSVYPGILVSLFGSIYLGIKYKISLELYILQIIIHSVPLLWISHNMKSLTHNILISGLYLLYIKLQNKNVYNIYDEHYKHLKAIKTINGFINNSNIRF